MKTLRLIYISIKLFSFFLILFTFFACKTRSECAYTIEDHESKIENDLNYRRYQDKDENTVYDESRANKGGFVYFFTDKNLSKFCIYNDPSTYCYKEEFDENGDLTQVIGSPNFSHRYFIDSNNKVHLEICFVQIKNKIINPKIYSPDSKRRHKITLVPMTTCSNAFFSSIYFSEEDTNSIRNSTVMLEFEQKRCNNIVQKYIDTLKLKDYFYYHRD